MSWLKGGSHSGSDHILQPCIIDRHEICLSRSARQRDPRMALMNSLASCMCHSPCHATPSLAGTRFGCRDRRGAALAAAAAAAAAVVARAAAAAAAALRSHQAASRLEPAKGCWSLELAPCGWLVSCCNIGWNLAGLEVLLLESSGLRLLRLACAVLPLVSRDRPDCCFGEGAARSLGVQVMATCGGPGPLATAHGDVERAGCLVI